MATKKKDPYAFTEAESKRMASEANKGYNEALKKMFGKSKKAKKK